MNPQALPRKYAPPQSTADVLRVKDCDHAALAAVLSCFGLNLVHGPNGLAIPGSFWGEEEAGLIGDRLYVRDDTPIHSLLHEACHFICMDPARRGGLHTDAGGDDLEECAVCYLQVILAAHVGGMEPTRMMADMDRWGYSFRLGSTRAWFERDADDAKAWLREYGLVDDNSAPTFQLRTQA